MPEMHGKNFPVALRRFSHTDVHKLINRDLKEQIFNQPNRNKSKKAYFTRSQQETFTVHSADWKQDGNTLPKPPSGLREGGSKTDDRQKRKEKDDSESRLKSFRAAPDSAPVFSSSQQQEDM